MLKNTVLVIFLTILVTSQGIIFDCNFRTSQWTQIDNLYTCNVRQVTPSGSNTALADVRGIHLPGQTNENVQAIENLNTFSYNRIPTNLKDFFPNLIGIYFWRGNITTISAEDLQPFPNLRIFGIESHRLVTIDGNLFKHTPRVQIVMLSDNLIENVGLNLLTGLTNLNIAVFLRNTCINSFADTPAGLENLRNELISQCPPLVCPIRCTINEETDELRSQVNELQEKLIALEARLNELSPMS